MVSQRYQLLIPTLAIVEVNGHHTVVYVPMANFVTVVHGPLNGGRLIDVEWNGRAAIMFASDLRDRATLVKEAAG
jgi:hypothetical protein